MRHRRAARVILAVLLAMSLVSCSGGHDDVPGPQRTKLKVVASLFPLYDFARAVGNGYADISLLLPPGVEPHNFEPTPADMAKLNSADVFIYTNRYMEPWAEAMLKGTDRGRILIVDASRGIDFLRQAGDEGGSQEGKTHGHGEAQRIDPHIWLDLGNAEKMLDTIRDAFISRDPVHRDIYLKNSGEYRAKLAMLDQKYREDLSACRKKVMVDGGHYTFGYLAARYGLKYLAAYGLSPEAEPTAGDLARISRIVRQEGLSHIFYEELLSPRIADTIARETGATLLRLHGAHNISREELREGTTFISLMEKNLDQLVTGLQCR